MGHVETEDVLPASWTPVGLCITLTVRKALFCVAVELEATAFRRRLSPTLKSKSFLLTSQVSFYLLFDLVSSHQESRHRSTEEVMKMCSQALKIRI